MEINGKINKTQETVFITAWIARCLTEIKEITAQEICQKAVNFLIKQRKEDYSFNYFKEDKDKDKNKNNKNLYPNDLDDTFLAWSVISKIRPSQLTPTAWAKLTKLLIKSETQPGGPYQTWLIKNPVGKWHDLDPVVNANIHSFLEYHKIHNTNLKNYLEKIVKKQSYKSLYYDYFTVRSLMAEYCNTVKKDLLLNNLKTDLNNQKVKSSIFKTSLLVSSLLKNEVNPALVQETIRRLKSCLENRRWPLEKLYLEQAGRHKLYATSPCLVAAQTALAFQRYELAIKQKVPNNFTLNETDDYILKTFEQIRIIYQKFPQTENCLIHKQIDKLEKSSQVKNITLLPIYCFKSFDLKNINNKILAKISLANTLGWLVYGLKDKIIDHQEGGNLLPAIFHGLLNMQKIYTSILPPHALDELYEILEDSELSLIKEQDKRYDIDKKFQNGLYKKINASSTIARAAQSMPHAFSALAVLYLAGYKQTSQTISCLKIFFINYLAAKQTMDDAHDWLEDLDEKIITPVVEDILASEQKLGENNRTIEEARENLKKIFWQDRLNGICFLITEHLKQAERSLMEIKDLKDKSYFMDLLDNLKQVVNKTIQEKNTTLEFLRALSKIRS